MFILIKPEGFTLTIYLVVILTYGRAGLESPALNCNTYKLVIPDFGIKRISKYPPTF